jgi:hypothetical protein
MQCGPILANVYNKFWESGSGSEEAMGFVRAGRLIAEFHQQNAEPSAPTAFANSG